MSSNSHGNLEKILNDIKKLADEHKKITIGLLLSVIGRRSFGPILFFAGLILVAPGIADIPGVPVLIGFILLIIIIQVLMFREYFWLPNPMRCWSISSKQLTKNISRFQKLALYVDRFFKPRLNIFVTTKSTWMISFFCLLIVLATPVMELIPFSANLAGLIFMAFGISLISQDGLFALMTIGLLILLIGVIVGFIVSIG